MSKAPENMLTATQAAQVAGVSRWAIHRAIRSMSLKAVRDNRNIWRIAPDDLAAWRAATVAPQLHAQGDAQSETAGVRDRLAVLEIERDGLRENLADANLRAAVAAARAEAAEADRDHWRAMAESLAARRRWWPFK